MTYVEFRISMIVSRSLLLEAKSLDLTTANSTHCLRWPSESIEINLGRVVPVAVYAEKDTCHRDEWSYRRTCRALTRATA